MPRLVSLFLCLVVLTSAGCTGLRSAPAAAPPGATVAPTLPPAVASSTGPSHRDLQYADSRRALDLYLPAHPGPAPVVLWLHGGSWVTGDKRPLPELLRGLRERGFAVAAVNYRLTGITSHPAQLHDVKGAVRWLRAHAETYGLDPARVYYVGFSAGAHLASLAALTANDPALEGDVGGNLGQSSAVSGVVAIAGPTDLLRLAGDCEGCQVSPEFRALGCSFLLCGERGRAASPLTYVHRAAPPFLLLHGDADRIVPPEQAKLLDAALREVGVPTSLVLIQGGQHGTSDVRADEAARAFLMRLAGLEG